MKIVRTKKEIEKKIKELVKYKDNYGYDSYGQTLASEYQAKDMLDGFVLWLRGKGGAK